ncbi:zinc finger protein 282-like isoform X4 [Pleurodeles waltl]|uniref:zinc finger protein 282-like isoform X4 n=1 Tax=Pleurodeles waltl TaxID=8319 RepID=UPI00370988F7
MYRQHTDEVPAPFHEVSSCFSEEEWKILQEWQKELCGNVMKEIHQALILLGPLIATSVFSLRVKREQQLYPGDSLEFKKRLGVNSFPGDHGTLSIKREDSLVNCHQEIERRETHNYPNKQVPSSPFIAYPDVKVKEGSSDFDTGAPHISSVFSLHTKPEDETRSQDTMEVMKRTSGLFTQEPPGPKRSLSSVVFPVSCHLPPLHGAWCFIHINSIEIH